jgi:hypothetical protein
MPNVRPGTTASSPKNTYARDLAIGSDLKQIQNKTGRRTPEFKTIE